MKTYAEFAAAKTLELLAIDSPSGFTKRAAAWVKNEFESLGYKVTYTVKGAVLIDLGGKSNEEGLLLAAHTDTLGAMVAEVKSNGRLRAVNVGGLKACNTETENVRIYARDGRVYEGTFQLINASAHVNPNLTSTERTFDTVEVVLDENVKTADDVKALGIDTGAFICPDPRAHITASGYIKSRYLDDKLSVGMLLAYAKYLKDNGLTPAHRTYVLITVYEEVGHGGACPVPDGVTEMICVDMGCVGEGLKCTEREVSICVKDSAGPYDYDIVNKLIAAAEKEKADYVLDVYPFYTSDVDVAVKAGNDIRHGCIGAGVYASHGYERSHMNAVESTLKVLRSYIETV